MDKRRALAALLVLSLGSCSRHEHLAPINYSPPHLPRTQCLQ